MIFQARILEWVAISSSRRSRIWKTIDSYICIIELLCSIPETFHHLLPGSVCPSIFKDRFIIFPGGSDGKASACNAGHQGLIPGLGRSCGEGKWQSTLALLPGKSPGRRILIGYSPWGHKESNTTERLHFHFYFLFIIWFSFLFFDHTLHLTGS